MATEKVITLNDDFTDTRSDVPALLKNDAPFAILIQEGKRSRFGRILRRLRRQLRKRQAKGLDLEQDLGDYRQVQKIKTDATAGLAIVWDAAKAPLVAGPFFRVLVEPRGAAMLPRGVLWVVVDHPAWGETVLATTHRPPGRYAYLWPAYDTALARWVAHRPFPVLLGLDTNTRRLHALARKMGMTVAGKGIDAVMATGRRLSKPRRLKRRNSDHRPVAVDAQ